MRQTLMGMVAAAAVMTVGAAPAMACGFGGCCGGFFTPCAPAYVPSYTYNYGYGYAGYGYAGWAYERLVDPNTQYYYVNQGPTYTGPGAFAPYPTYNEDAYPGYYGYGYRRHHAYHRWHYSRYYHGRRVLRRYD